MEENHMWINDECYTSENNPMTYLLH